jgi:hypothetical protein
METTAMAKAKGEKRSFAPARTPGKPVPPPARGVGAKPTAVTVKGSPEWREWVNRGARHCRTEVAKVIDAALVDYFKARGFTEEAPER